MIDNNKLLSRDRMVTGRNVVTIKRNLIKIDSLLKERLVLVKVRQGILRQQEQNRMRRQREDNLESLQSTSVQTDTSDKQGSNFLSGLVKSILGLSGIFLPQLLRLLNFLKRIVDPIKNMATATFKALSSFLKVGATAVDKISDAFNFKGSTLKGLDAATITTKFNKFEFALNTFVNALLFAGAMQTLSNLPDLKQIKKFLSKINIGSKVTKAPIRGKRFDDLGTIEELFKKNPLYQELNAKDFKAMNIQYSDLSLKQRMANAFEMDKRGIKKFPEVSQKGKQIRLDKAFQKEFEQIVMPEFPIFDFLERNNLKSPTRMAIELNKIYKDGKVMLASAVKRNVIDFNEFFELSDIFDFRYQKQMLEIGQYGEDVLKLIKNTAAETMSPKELSAAKKIFDKTQKNIINEEFFEGFNKGRKITKKTAEETIKKFADKPVGAAARSMFPTTMPDLIYPSLFERGRSALFEAGEFFKGVDKTMVDFATKQTDKIASVITSGPLRGFTQGAKGMFRKAVGETIGLVPFLGDLIGLLLDIYLFGEIPERAGYKTIGGILGGFVGALIGSIPALVPFGGPIIGSIIGGIGGDILGGIVYDMVKGKDTEVKTSDVGSSSVKNVVKEGLITFGKGGFTGRGDSRQLAGLVHFNEQVFDQDTTLAVRQNAPGFFEDLNRAKGFESLEVLRNFASYEGTQNKLAHFIPIPIPMPRKEVPPVIDMATGEVREDLVSSYHYARG